jgi:hypothetical protein
MFRWIKPSLPVTHDQMQWVDRSFVRLVGLLGTDRLLQAHVMLPIPEDSPDPYDGSKTALRRILSPVASAMQIDPTDIKVTLFTDDMRCHSKLPAILFRQNGGGGRSFFSRSGEQARHFRERKSIEESSRPGSNAGSRTMPSSVVASWVG